MLMEKNVNIFGWTLKNNGLEEIILHRLNQV